MVKFDEKGQAYWDFILENFPDELIKEIEKLDEVENGQIYIFNVYSRDNEHFKVYIKDKIQSIYWIVSCYKYKSGVKNQHLVEVNRFARYELEMFFGESKIKELFSNE